MARLISRIYLLVTARPLRAAFFLGALCAAGATTLATADNGKHATTTAATAGAPDVKVAAQASTKPLWRELTKEQQVALAPLALEWDKLDPIRKQKWLEISNKFQSMKPEDQQRLQDRMREWAKLTPEQRRVARENFSRAKKLDADQKSAKWEQYQQLPDEQKKQLAAASSPKKQVANLPPASSKPRSVPPIKSTPKPLIEKSLTPQGAAPSALDPVRKVSAPASTPAAQPAVPPSPPVTK